MSLDSVRAFFAEHAPDIEVTVKEESTATVAEAAAALSVTPAEIAKTLSIQAGDDVVLIVTRGDARLDNKKAKATFGSKVKMLGLDVVEEITGHPVGGVCPFGLARSLRVCCDVSLKAFDLVYPAAGAVNAAVCLSPDRMVALTGADWVDVCKDPEGD
ncbi:MAG: YbaK/EbsC family protein [Pannonibacter sp.]